jgi:acyl-CoA dehydrogenase
VNAEDCIIGGLSGAGKGWKMLMECLAAGRGISLPAQATGATKLTMRVTSAHASVRKQFGISIGKFEGVEEPLARIAGTTYLIEALRKYVLSALDQGVKPSVVTAMAKYTTTELARKAINDGLDVMGGCGISMGPRNSLAIPYIGIPISITVEGANILTRTLMVFGQGALRAHPFAFKEVDAIEKNDLKGFDQAFWGHIGHIVRNSFRALILSVTRGYILPVPGGMSTRRHFQRLAWASATFAITADLAMGLLGGKLKIKEKLTGRFADILSWMFIASAVLRRFEAEGRKAEDLPYVQYAMKTAFMHIQNAFDGIYANMDVPVIGFIFRHIIGRWSKINTLDSEPSDALTHKIASLMLTDSEQRERLTAGIYMPADAKDGIARLEKAFKAVKNAEAVEHKLRAAVAARTLPKLKSQALYDAGVAKNVITAKERDLLMEAEKLAYDAVLVDDYAEAEYVVPQKTHIGVAASF